MVGLAPQVLWLEVLADAEVDGLARQVLWLEDEADDVEALTVALVLVLEAEPVLEVDEAPTVLDLLVLLLLLTGAVG